MNAVAERDVVGLLELTDSEGLLESFGPDNYSALRDDAIKRLQQWLREGDQWEPNEDNRFCVTLRDIEGEGQIKLAASKLERLFAEPYYLMGSPIQMQVRAGFSATGTGAGDPRLALRQARKALRQAHSACTQFEIYSPRVEQKGNRERSLLKELEMAVESGQLELYFQPKFHAGYRTLLGAEALLRWHHADSEEVRPPGDFIPLAERSEVIRPMTWWVIKATVARLARWPQELSVSVNVTPSLLLDDEVLRVVEDALDIHQVEPGRLTLEVTESIMVDRQDTMMRQLARLRKLGVRVSIDDFGTGFSSLAYFRDLPADEIKIDKSFVMAMLKSDKDAAIVRAVIDLAHNFSLQVVAEGVETEAIAERLGELRCDVLQGFAFDPPLLVEEFEMHYIRSSGGPRRA